MDKHALSAVIVLLLLVATQAHELRGSSSSSSAGSVSGVSIGHAPVEAGDPPVHPSAARTMNADGSSSAHEDEQVVDATRTVLHAPPRATVPLLPSFNSKSSDASLSASPVDVVSDAILDAATCYQSSASADDSSSSHTAGFTIEPSAPSRSDSERATITTTAPALYVFSSSSLPTSSSSSSESSSSTAAIPVDVFESVSSYSAGTVEPSEERTEVESTALELSTSSEQVQDAVTTTASTDPSSDTRTTSPDGQEEDDEDDADTPSIATSDSTLSSPIFYGCVVLGVAGLVGTGFVFRAKRQHSSKTQWTIATEAFVETPPMRPPISQVRVVIDDHNFAIL